MTDTANAPDIQVGGLVKWATDLGDEKRNLELKNLKDSYERDYGETHYRVREIHLFGPGAAHNTCQYPYSFALETLDGRVLCTSSANDRKRTSIPSHFNRCWFEPL